MKHATTAMIIAITITTALAGCGSTGEDLDETECIDSGNGFQTCTVRMEAGRRVPCVIWAGSAKGGISCDWGHADGADNL